MKDKEIEKTTPFEVSKMVEYQTGSVVQRAFINKTTGSIHAVAYSPGSLLPDNISLSDSFIQILEGTTEITIDKKVFALKKGESIIIPSLSRGSFKPNNRFKALITVIKSNFSES